MHDLEYARVPPGRNVSPPPHRRFGVEGDDAAGRFVPGVFTVALPLPYRGVLRVSPAASPPPEDGPGFYLFSSPARAVAGGLAAVRADLVHQATDDPAAHAVLEVTAPDGSVWRGIADAAGRVSVLLPYPTLVARLDTSPSVPAALSDQRWILRLRVRSAPAHLVYPVGSTVADLRSIVMQPYATVWETEGGAPSHDRLVELVFGEPLVLRSEPRSVLLVGPGS
jgi:hypothetical protein